MFRSGDHLYSSLKSPSRSERRRLMNCIRQSVSLSHFHYALHIDGGSGAQIEDTLVAGQFSLHVQSGRRVSNEWMKEEDRIEQHLKEIDVVIPATKMHPLVAEDRGPFFGTRPRLYVRWKQDHRPNQSRELR
jgi:hypothetical protein